MMRYFSPLCTVLIFSNAFAAPLTETSSISLHFKPLPLKLTLAPAPKMRKVTDRSFYRAGIILSILGSVATAAGASALGYAVERDRASDRECTLAEDDVLICSPAGLQIRRTGRSAAAWATGLLFAGIPKLIFGLYTLLVWPSTFEGRTSTEAPRW